jgi:hypothetical protein
MANFVLQVPITLRSFTVSASSNPNYFEKFEEVVKKRRDMILDINENGANRDSFISLN